MSTLHTFFKGDDVHFGVFYPSGYLIAIFKGLPSAVRASEDVRNSGLFQQDDVVAVSGEDVLKHNQEHKGVFSTLMTGLSRMFATEAVWADHDLSLAREGCALLAVYAPTEGQKNTAWEQIEPSDPISARYYALGLGGVEHLAGDHKENEIDRA